MSGIGAIAAGSLAAGPLVPAGPSVHRDLADLLPAVRHEAPAGFARRSAAAAIDALVVVLFVLIESAVLVGWLGLSAPRDGTGSADLPYFAITAVFLFLYFAKTESGPHAATWGKRALRLAVRDRNGEPPSLGRATLRLVLRGLTAVTLLLGWLTILFTPRRQALHDLLSGTVVVAAGDSQRIDNRGERR